MMERSALIKALVLTRSEGPCVLKNSANALENSSVKWRFFVQGKASMVCRNSLGLEGAQIQLPGLG